MEKIIIVFTCSIIVIYTVGCGGPSSEVLAVTMVAQTDEAATQTFAAIPTHTPTLTDTPIPNTSTPTQTTVPTNTPNIALTQQSEAFLALLQDFEDRGYVSTTRGEVIELEPFIEEWAQIDWFRWWTYDVLAEDFLFKSHLKWSTASSTPEESGCGVVFGLQENGDFYSVFLDSNRVLFLMNRGAFLYEVGKTSGSGRKNFGNPAEADFILAVNNQKAYVSVDEEVTQYTLSADQTTHGEFAFSVLSGTNKDYGTRCEMTESIFWIPE